MGSPHGGHVGISLDLDGGVLFAFLGKNLHLHDHRAQLWLFVKAIDQVIIIPNRDLLTRAGHCWIDLGASGSGSGRHFDTVLRFVALLTLRSKRETQKIKRSVKIKEQIS